VMSEKKDTVGKIALEILGKEEHNPDVVGQQREMLQDYEKNVMQAVQNGTEQFNGDFYVVVSTKQEKLLKNIIRNYFFPRESCPSPQHDQVVYKYRAREQRIELLWVVPGREACEIFRNDPLGVPAEERDLLMDVLSFYDGSLLKKCMTLNGEIKEEKASKSFDPQAFDDQDNHRIIS